MPSDYLEIHIIGHLAGSSNGQQSRILVKLREKDGPAFGKALVIQECLNLARELKRSQDGQQRLIVNTKRDSRRQLFYNIDRSSDYSVITSCSYGTGFK